MTARTLFSLLLLAAAGCGESSSSDEDRRDGALPDAVPGGTDAAGGGGSGGTTPDSGPVGGSPEPMDGRLPLLDAAVDAGLGDVPLPPADQAVVPADGPRVLDAVLPPPDGPPPDGPPPDGPPLDGPPPPVDAGQPPDAVLLPDAAVLGPCSLCHGNLDNAAPPRSLLGAVDTDVVGVGAHQAHVRGGLVAGPVACDECHIVPVENLDPGHIDAPPAELTFGPLARTEGAVPAWNPAAATCSSSYCHGATLTGGVLTEPVWTTVDGSQSRCGSCHGVPPPAPHPASPNCAGCHPGTVLPDGTIDVAGGQHVNGQVDVAAVLACDACHGANGNAAPPPAVNGSLLTTEPGVGAHDVHLQGGSMSAGFDCTECHLVPLAVGDLGHLDASPGAELTFGPLAIAGGSAPSYSTATRGCSDAYCHGATLAGGVLTEPVWTTVDGSQAACGACHGMPPPAPHPPVATCMTCHSTTMNADGTVNVAGGLHVNGAVDLAF